MHSYRLRSGLHPIDFLATMQPVFEEHEARHGLMLGVVMRLTEGVQENEKNYLAIVEAVGKEGTQPAAAAMMTPPHGIVVYSRESSQDSTHVGGEHALQLIARDLYQHGWTVPSINGLRHASQAFARSWSNVTGKELIVSSQLRVFGLRSVVHPDYSPGRCRLATKDDLDIVSQWLFDFTKATEHLDQTIQMADARIAALQRVKAHSFFVWDDDGPVSLTGVQRPTRHGITIGPVYTPPEFRGRGYATSCVAEVSQKMLDGGKDFCTLFTDLANPTSNHIYQEIGYRPVGDYSVYRYA